MAISLCEVSINDAPLRAAAGEWSDAAGGVVDFWGVVRADENGKKIDGIDYEAHRVMAEHQCKLIAEKAAEDFGLGKVILRHRIGFVRAGEASLFLRVAAKHRSAAFDASQWIVHELKQRVPIWKRPIFSNKQDISILAGQSAERSPSLA